MLPDDKEAMVLLLLRSAGAVYAEFFHFVYTSGKHGTSYINARALLHHTDTMMALGNQMAGLFAGDGIDLVIGPETGGRTLADKVAQAFVRDVKGDDDEICAIWCSIADDPDGDEGDKIASFDPKLDFGRLVKGKRVLVVDDLLTTGVSVLATIKLIREYGGYVVGVVVVVRRGLDVTEATLGVPRLESLADVDLTALSEEECQDHGPCSRHEPITRRPGHGWEYEVNHPDYPGGFVDV